MEVLQEKVVHFYSMLPLIVKTMDVLHGYVEQFILGI